MEIPAPTFCELQKNVSRVQLISDPQRMAELCAEVGNIWTPEVHHMNGQIYTVVENLPPNKYAVYDPVCGKKGLQGGKIFVPSKAVTVVDEQVMTHESGGIIPTFCGKILLHSFCKPVLCGDCHYAPFCIVFGSPACWQGGTPSCLV